jgi:hypothetical protein
MFIPDQKTATKERSKKVIAFILATNFTKLNYFSFEVLKKKIWARQCCGTGTVTF